MCFEYKFEVLVLEYFNLTTSEKDILYFLLHFICLTALVPLQSKILARKTHGQLNI